MKRDFASSINHARSKYLPVVAKESASQGGKTDGIIEELMGSIKKGLKGVANATNKINTFAQNQKHGGTFGAMNNAGMFDPKGDEQLVRAEWDKLDAGAQEAWQQKGQTFTPKMKGKDYFYNQKMKDLADRKTGAVRPGVPAGSGSSTQTQQTPAQQEQAWREDFRNKPNIIQWAQGNGMDEQGYVDLMKAQQ